MEIELQEIVEFLSKQWLFSTIPQPTIRTFIPEIEIRYVRRGQRFPPEQASPGHCYLVRSGAIEFRNDSQQLIDKMAEGDIYLSECITDMTVNYEALSCEDTLLYLLPCYIIKTLRGKFNHFDHLIRAYSSTHFKRPILDQASDTFEKTVKQILNYEPVCVQHDTSIVNTAKIMSSKNSSCALVMKDNKLVGLVSDSDLRRRCLANNISRDRAIADIMTTQLITINENTSLTDAIALMTKHQIHHLPVLSAEKVVANLGTSEMFHAIGSSATLITSEINKANSLERLVQISKNVPELQIQLSQANSHIRHMGAIISSITDAFTQRLISLAESELGAPPVPYAWMAGGSQGRLEQNTHTDQDNALIISDDYKPEFADYFSQLSQFVCDGLNACGYPYCPGNAMASNPQWRQTATVWRAYFTQWVEQPDKKALMLSSIFFDLRLIHGERTLYKKIQKQLLELTTKNQIFIAHLVSNALTHTPPLGIFRQFILMHDGQHEDSLDIKHRGLVPLVDIARIYALSEGISAVNTRERLQQATRNGALSHAMCDDLIGAYEYISYLRNEHQMQQQLKSQQVDNYINPLSLSGLQRKQLKDAFAIIKDMQAVLVNRYQAARLL